MRFHVPALPHTLPTKEYVRCAYTEKVRKFGIMMPGLGHEVFTYVSDEPLPPEKYLEFPFDPENPVWQRQNERMINAININAAPGDFLCLIAGRCQKQIADAFTGMLPAVEFGIGYYGVFAPFLVFESYAHQAHVYGRMGQMTGRFYDAVIPNYYDPRDFPFSAEKDDYLLFMARLNEDKGLHVAVDIAKRLGKRLVVCGQGVPPTDPCVEYLGVVDAEQRGILLSRAQALLSPTLYLEPFGGVAVEAQFCGTPVITTDWGAYPETVAHGITGFRCRYLGEFLDAVEQCRGLDPVLINRRAVDRFSMGVVAHQYEAYFSRLTTLQEQGWYTEALVTA